MKSFYFFLPFSFFQFWPTDPQAVVSKVYPARLSLNTLICFFASLQSSFLALFFARNPTLWKLEWNMQLLTIIYSVSAYFTNVSLLWDMIYLNLKHCQFIYSCLTFVIGSGAISFSLLPANMVHQP
jgi:hypothetical protein